MWVRPTCRFIRLILKRVSRRHYWMRSRAWCCVNVHGLMRKLDRDSRDAMRAIEQVIGPEPNM